MLSDRKICRSKSHLKPSEDDHLKHKGLSETLGLQPHHVELTP